MELKFPSLLLVYLHSALPIITTATDTLHPFDSSDMKEWYKRAEIQSWEILLEG